MLDPNNDPNISTHPLHVLSTATCLPEPDPCHTTWAFPAIDNKADTLTQSQMFKASNATQFLASQPAEISGLIKMGVFYIQPMTSKPARAKLLSSIWSYHRKCSPVGEILKHKSRICIDGSQQLHGRDYWEVYAPVVSWSTIHLTLLLSTILDLKQHQVDYTQAFPQAPLEDPVYMKLPQGWYADENGTLLRQSDPTFHNKSYFIKVKHNLYAVSKQPETGSISLDSRAPTRGFLSKFCRPMSLPLQRLYFNCTHR